LQKSKKMEKNTSRRKFLVRTGIGLGVVIGASIAGCGPLRRMIAQKADESPSPYKNKVEAYIWFELQPNGGLLLHSPKIEMGQGIHTALAQIAAEELDIDWQKIKVVHASTQHGPVDPGVTGGSLSVSGLYEPLRELAATMREIIRINAATLLGVSVADVSFKNGVAMAGGKSIELSDIAQKTTNWNVKIDKPRLKTPAEFQIIGKPIPRLDLEAKVKGAPIFGIDAGFPDMLFGSVVRAPVFGAIYKGAEAGTVGSMSGVVKVVIEKDFVGVIAKSRIEAEDAKRQLKVNWQMPTKLAQQSEVDALVKVGAGNDVVIQKEGNTSKHLGEGNVITKEYYAPLGVHAHIEPNGASAFYQNGSVVVKLSTQVVGLTQKDVAKALDIDAKKVDIQPQFAGGGFGRRLQTPHAVEAALMSKAVGKPVHVFFDRFEEFQNGFLRPPSHNVLKAVLNTEGSILAMEHHAASADVAFNSAVFTALVKPMPAGLIKKIIGADVGAWRGSLIQYHNIPNYSTTAWHNELPFQTSWWRGLGLLPNAFAIESFMDELAHAAKKDPLAFRLRHLADDPRSQTIKGVLNAVAEKAGWGKPLPQGRAMGLACSIDVNTPCAQVAEVEIKDGQIKVRKVTCAIDPGLIINPDGVKAQTEGAIIMGLSAALFEEVSVKDGKVTPNKLGYYPIALMRDAPDIEVVLLSNGDSPRGVGEPPIGPIAAAIANAVFALTGKRLNRLPLKMVG
jgi:isoquinoline 1-oxidoreductase subunit beta